MCSLPIGNLWPAAKFPSHDRKRFPTLLKGSVPAWLDRIGVHSSEWGQNPGAKLNIKRVRATNGCAPPRKIALHDITLYT